MAYGGGFVGEVDDDPAHGAGTSTFTNCYTANCSVSSRASGIIEAGIGKALTQRANDYSYLFGLSY